MDKNDLSENEQSNSNVSKLIYLRKQQHLIEEIRQLTEKFEQIPQIQTQVIKLNHDKWSKMDNSVESLQEDIDWYVKEYIIPMQEMQQELVKLENSLISIPEKQGIVGKVGSFFERFIPGITKDGRQKRNIEEKKQVIQSEIDTYKFMMEKNPFQIFGANKDIKDELLAIMDINQLDKYSSMKNDFSNRLKPNNSAKSIVDSIKIEDMNKLLSSYPALKKDASYLIHELISNGTEAFCTTIGQIAKNSSKTKNELMSQIDFKAQEDPDKDILDDITQQIQNLMNNLTPEELSELNEIESSQDKGITELE